MLLARRPQPDQSDVSVPLHTQHQLNAFRQIWAQKASRQSKNKSAVKVAWLRMETKKLTAP